MLQDGPSPLNARLWLQVPHQQRQRQVLDHTHDQESCHDMQHLESTSSFASPVCSYHYDYFQDVANEARVWFHRAYSTKPVVGSTCTHERTNQIRGEIRNNHDDVHIHIRTKNTLVCIRRDQLFMDGTITTTTSMVRYLKKSMMCLDRTRMRKYVNIIFA